MKICAVICEFNPFHYGHLKCLEDAKEKSGADAIMCIMGGNFSQRGEAMVVNKHVRARIAIENGADIVVQIPTAYACSSAEIFALAGVKIANSFDKITHLAFGVETKKPEILTELAHFFLNEPKEFKSAIKKHLAEGNSLVVSRQKALEDMAMVDKINLSEITEAVNILGKPNNILAIEYLKALIKTNSKIVPIFIDRSESIYNSTKINGKNTSAMAIRARLYKKGIRSVKKFMPESAYRILKEEIKTFGLPNADIFNDLCMYVAKTKSHTEIKEYFDVVEGLENRIAEYSKQTKDLNEFLINVKTKRYTYARLKRIMLSMLLNIKAETVNAIYEIDKLPYIKVLAFRGGNKELLKSVNANTNLVIRISNVPKKKSGLSLDLSLLEDRANQVYNMLLSNQKEVPEYTPDIYTTSTKI